MALNGWHALIIVGMFLLAAAVVVGLALLIVVLARKLTAKQQPVAAPQLSSAAQRVSRLAELDVLSQNGMITESEYEAKRAEILAEI